MPDLSVREMMVLAPLVACIFWIGIYPAPILNRVEASAEALVARVRSQGTGEILGADFAAEVETK